MVGRGPGGLWLLSLACLLLGTEAFVGIPAARYNAASASRSPHQVGALALRAEAASALPEADSFIKLVNAKLRKVDGAGVAIGAEIRGASLFSDATTVIFATRRPG